MTAVSEFDHVRWSGNTLVAIDSAGGSPVLVRNSEGGLAASDLQNVNLLGCLDDATVKYCQPEYCSNEDVGISCWCVADGITLDPNDGSCANSPQINVPEHELTILVTKPGLASGTFFFLNKGDNDLVYTLQQPAGSESPTFNVTPSSGTLTREQAVETMIFTLDSAPLQARSKGYVSRFSLLSNSLSAADRNATIMAQVFVSADPVASLSNVTLRNPNDLVAGGRLAFHLTLVDTTQIVILDASNLAFSAVLTHLTSNTSVSCGVTYDAGSKRHEGNCDLPKLVCAEVGSLECEIAVGGFALQVEDGQKTIVGSHLYYFLVDSCPETYYRSNDRTCLFCPENVRCPAGSSVEDWLLDAGYWRTGGTSTKVYECAFGDVSCPGHGNGTNSATDPYCAPEYVGPLCSECADNFFYQLERQWRLL